MLVLVLVLCITSIVTGLSVALGVYFARRPRGKKYYPVDRALRPGIVEYRCISLPYRRNKFERMEKMFAKQGLTLKLFNAINGKDLHIERYHERFLTKSYRNHFSKKPNHKGHLGATFSHLGMLQLICDEDLGVTAVFEDDCTICKDFESELLDCIQKVDLIDPDWDVLQLGFSCSYKSYGKCRQNDGVEIQAGRIIRLGYGIGLFGYVVNGTKGAQNMLQNMFPINWHIDHWWQTLNTRGVVKLYATIPNIVFHPGTVEISSFNEVYKTPYRVYVSDSNG